MLNKKGSKTKPWGISAKTSFKSLNDAFTLVL